VDLNELATWGDRIGRAVYRPGLCYQSNPPGGDAGQGGGGGSPTPPATPSTPPSTGAPATPPAGDKGAGSGEPETVQAVPYTRFKEVNDELQARKAADAERERKDKEAKGQWEQVAKDRETETAAAKARGDRLAVRSAFVSAASGKVADAVAAFTLAEAQGMTKDLKPDADDNVDAKDVAKVVDKVLEAYPFLASTGKPAPGGTFGQPTGGAGAAPAGDPSKLSTREKMSRGLEEDFRRRGIAIPTGRGNPGQT